MARMLILVVATAMALISMMFLIMVRISDPLVPRAIFGMLNTVLYFPSGAVYPTESFPGWMKAIAVVDPFTYAVHGFKELVLKNTGLDGHQLRPRFPHRLHRDNFGLGHSTLSPDIVILIAFRISLL